MIRSSFIIALATVGCTGLVGCSASVKAPEVAVVAPPPPVVAVEQPVVVAAPVVRLTTVCDAEIRPQGHLHFPHEVEFDIGKASIKSTPQTNAILQCLVDFLANNKMVTKFRIEGHTDNQGSEASNMTLSQARADAIIGWLSLHGVPNGKLWAKGYGPSRPLSPNDSPEHMAQNRRVEFHIDELDGIKATRERIAIAMNPPATVVTTSAPAVGVAVATPGVAVAVPTVAVAAPSVAVSAPTVAVPSSVSVGVGVGGSTKKH